MPKARQPPDEPDADPLGSELARLRDLHIEALRVRWRMIFRRDAPPHLPRHLLFAMIAYRLQAEVMGDLDAKTLRFLKQIDLASSKQAAIPLTQAFDQRKRALPPGTVLTREWNGRNHQVIVVGRGFSCEGRTYKSLSEIAKAITGTNWNGPRFFGLRDKKSREAPP